MEIKTKDDALFSSEHEQIRKAILTILDENQMLVLNVIPDDLKKIRALITAISKRYEFRIITKYDKNEEKLYVAIENTRLRDYNLAIEALSKYANMSGIVRDITEKRNEVLQYQRNREYTKD